MPGNVSGKYNEVEIKAVESRIRADASLPLQRHLSSGGSIDTPRLTPNFSMRKKKLVVQKVNEMLMCK